MIVTNIELWKKKKKKKKKTSKKKKKKKNIHMMICRMKVEFEKVKILFNEIHGNFNIFKFNFGFPQMLVDMP